MVTAVDDDANDEDEAQVHLVPGGQEKTAPRLFVAVHSRYL